MGAWEYVRPRLQLALRQLYAKQQLGEDWYPGMALDACIGEKHMQFIGRPPAASPATASFAIHQKETKDIIDAALGLQNTAR